MASVLLAPDFNDAHKEVMNVIWRCGTWGFLGRWLRLVLVGAGMAGAAVCCSGMSLEPGQRVAMQPELVEVENGSGQPLNPIHGDEAAVNGAPRVLRSFDPAHGAEAAVNGAPGVLATEASDALNEASSGINLPDAPEPQEQQPDQSNKPLMTERSKTVAATTSMPMAPMYSRIIPAGMATPQIHKWDKITLATRNLYSLTSVVSFFTSAGWDQLTNGQPNYGTDRGAFGERLGAAAIRDSSQAFLSDGPFAVWFHQDPRYFALGSQSSIPRRVWYAATRALVTRDSTDGHAVMNTSLILGQAAGTALNNLYYPKSNRNFHDNLAGFGGSMGGAALSFVMDEFTSDLLRAIRLKHGQNTQ